MLFGQERQKSVQNLRSGFCASACVKGFAHQRIVHCSPICFALIIFAAAELKFHGLACRFVQPPFAASIPLFYSFEISISANKKLPDRTRRPQAPYLPRFHIKYALGPNSWECPDPACTCPPEDIGLWENLVPPLLCTMPPQWFHF